MAIDEAVKLDGGVEGSGVTGRMEQLQDGLGDIGR